MSSMRCLLAPASQTLTLPHPLANSHGSHSSTFIRGIAKRFKSAVTNTEAYWASDLKKKNEKKETAL